MAQPKLQWKVLPSRAFLDEALLRSNWDRLNAQRGDLPFMSSEAVQAALQIFGNGSEVLAVGSAEGRCQAMFLLVPDGRLRWRTFQPSQLPLGTWVAEAGLELQGLSQDLIRGPLGMSLAVSVTQVDPLYAAPPMDGDSWTAAPYIDTAWVDIQGSFDDYWQQRGKNLRQNMRKQRNKLASDGVTSSMRVLSSVADMAPALRRYGALESTGWKGENGTAIHPDNEQGRFYLQLFEAAAAHGEAVFYEYLFDQQTVAMNLCLLRAGQLIVLKTAYDESIKTLSPAFLLREEEMQLFFGNSGIHRVEYFGKVMDWHTKLTSERRTLYHLTQFRWPWLKRFVNWRKARTTEPANAEVGKEGAGVASSAAHAARTETSTSE